MVKKGTAQLHAHYQIWADPLLPDWRGNHDCFNCFGSVPSSSYGVVWLCVGSALVPLPILSKHAKKEHIPRVLAIFSGICQFFFLFDVLAVMALALKERHLVKTTIIVCIATGLCILLTAFLLVVR